MTDEPITPSDTFEQLGLNPQLLQAVDEVGYEVPTPIQSRTIPALLAGRDLIGQAQTGTGKTAAFALPILQRLDLQRKQIQALVLTPTRELALQVADAIHTYSKHLGRVQVLPVYGGQPIQKQMARLNAGIHIVVGTPGRIMDHLRRGTLNFEALQFVVLDEADEMLRMGFIEDVEWILSQAPAGQQIALFSATIPKEIRRIADRYLKNPVAIEIERRTLTVPTIEQRYINVSEQQKLDALTRLLETEVTEAVLIFVHTKIRAAEVAEKLQARGYAAEAMHGDMSQAQRESVIRRLRSGQVELIVATDVAARGLDIEHIGLVVNYDIPNDTESYVHRIGRTGRAGREGKAILFLTPRQQRMMRDIERYTGQRIEAMKMPTKADVATRRIAMFKDSIRKTMIDEDLELYLGLVEELAGEGFDMAEIAAAAARLARRDKPLEVELEPEPAQATQAEEGMVRLFIDAGRRTGVRPGDIVGAIANEAGVPGKAIGAIDIYDRFTFVDVPLQYKAQVLERMANSEIRNRPISIKVATPQDTSNASNAREREGGAPPRRDGKKVYHKGSGGKGTYQGNRRRDEGKGQE
ncbi:MAG: DEAD/DEAH box helicase [Ardenticatenales bacterium]|nr:DEAD/DEAH box helicase [Ardenticatenales bacterium]